MNVKNWEKEFDATMEYCNDGNDYFYEWISVDSEEGSLTDILEKWLDIYREVIAFYEEGIGLSKKGKKIVTFQDYGDFQNKRFWCVFARINWEKCNFFQKCCIINIVIVGFFPVLKPGGIKNVFLIETLKIRTVLMRNTVNINS